MGGPLAGQILSSPPEHPPGQGLMLLVGHPEVRFSLLALEEKAGTAMEPSLLPASCGGPLKGRDSVQELEFLLHRSGFKSWSPLAGHALQVWRWLPQAEPQAQR